MSPARVIGVAAKVVAIAVLLGCSEPTASLRTALSLRTLHVAKVSELRLLSPEGPVIGRVHPGAVVRILERRAEHVAFELPFRSANGHERVVGWVHRAALATEPVPRAPVALRGRVVRDFSAALTYGKQRTPFATTLCGEILLPDDDPSRTVPGSSMLARTLLEDGVWDDGDPIHQQRWRRAIQVEAGVEIAGETEWILGNAGPIHCAARVVEDRPSGWFRTGGREPDRRVEALPASWIRVTAAPSDAFADLATEKARVHWLVQTREGPSCRAWTLEARRASAGGEPRFEGRLVRRVSTPTELVVHSYPLSYEAARPGSFGSLGLLGPYKTTYAAGRVDQSGWKCAHSLAFARRSGDTLELLRSRLDAVVAYHPDDVERWYLTEEACESARQAALRALSKDERLAARLGFSRGC